VAVAVRLPGGQLLAGLAEHPLAQRDDVGVAQQLLGAGGAGDALGDPDAGLHHHLVAGHLERGAQPGADPLGHLDRVLHAGQVGQEHGELVTAHAGRGVAGAQAGPQALPGRQQQLVAGVVAEAVVDDLEVVQVQPQQEHRLPAKLALAVSRRESC